MRFGYETPLVTQLQINFYFAHITKKMLQFDH